MSLGAQTRTNGTKITADLRTLTHVNLCWLSFAQEKPKHVFLRLSRPTELCFYFFNPREVGVIGYYRFIGSPNSCVSGLMSRAIFIFGPYFDKKSIFCQNYAFLRSKFQYS